jgi:hypothetical protein
MKHVMTMTLIATAMLAAPLAQADPDPHKPDVGANYCPGGAGVGGQPGQPVEPYCDGVPFDDGSYWHAVTRSGTNVTMVMCVVPPPQPGLFGGLVPQITGPVPAPPGGCSGP